MRALLGRAAPLESRVKPCVRMRSARLGFSSETNSTRDLCLAPGLAVSCLITKVPSVQAHPHTLCHPLRHGNLPARALSFQSNPFVLLTDSRASDQEEESAFDNW